MLLLHRLSLKRIAVYNHVIQSNDKVLWIFCIKHNS